MKSVRLQLLPLLLCAISIVGCNKSGKDNDDEKKPTTTPASKPSEPEEPKIKLTAEVIEKYGITVGAPKLEKLTPTFTVPGRVALNTNASARVGSLVAGRVVDIKANRGDLVKKGGELFTVESTDLGESQSDYLLKRTTLEAATSAVEPLKASYERARKLIESQGVSLSELQKREAELRAGEAAQQLAKGTLAASERKLSLLGMTKEAVDEMARTGKVTPCHIVRAPIDGRVIERDVTIGQFLAPDKDSPVLIADTSTLWILADVPEGHLAYLHLGDTARISAGGADASGVISAIAPTVDAATRSVQVRIDVKNDDTTLKPGMFAQAEIASAAQKDKTPEVLAIPESAVQVINGQTCVFVKDDEPNTFIKRPVAVGDEVYGRVAVLSGLEAKENIVLSGGFILKAEVVKAGTKEPD